MAEKLLETKDMENLLVAIDFNGDETPLLDKAVELAEKFDSKVWLIHVAAPDPDFVGYDVGPQSVRDSRASQLRKEHRQLQEYAQRLEKQQVMVTPLLLQGATIEVIQEEIDKLGIDLIIMGHHEHGFLHQAFMGSVSRKIIKKSNIPVLIVPLES